MRLRSRGKSYWTKKTFCFYLLLPTLAAWFNSKYTISEHLLLIIIGFITQLFLVRVAQIVHLKILRAFNRQFFKTPTNPIYSCPTACSHYMPIGPRTNHLLQATDPTTPETFHMINSPCQGTSFLTWTNLESRLATLTETTCCL